MAPLRRPIHYPHDGIAMPSICYDWLSLGRFRSGHRYPGRALGKGTRRGWASAGGTGIYLLHPRAVRRCVLASLAAVSPCRHVPLPPLDVVVPGRKSRAQAGLRDKKGLSKRSKRPAHVKSLGDASSLAPSRTPGKITGAVLISPMLDRDTARNDHGTFGRIVVSGSRMPLCVPCFPSPCASPVPAAPLRTGATLYGFRLNSQYVNNDEAAGLLSCLNSAKRPSPPQRALSKRLLLCLLPSHLPVGPPHTRPSYPNGRE